MRWSAKRCFAGLMTELMERLSAHMQAAAAMKGMWVTKSGDYSGGKLGDLDDAGREGLLGYCRQHGFQAELTAGNIGGLYLRLRVTM